MERVEGIEPSSSAWKAVALPLSYTRNSGPESIGSNRFPKDFSAPFSSVSPTLLGSQCGCAAKPATASVVGEVGLEPTKAYASGFTVRPLCHSGHSPGMLSPGTRPQSEDPAGRFCRGAYMLSARPPVNNVACAPGVWLPDK